MKETLNSYWKLRNLLFCLFLFVLSVSLLLINSDKPFIGEHDWNGVRYGNIARNYTRQNLFDIRFAQIENSGPIKEPQYFTHYPPILPLSIAAVYKVTGISEFTTRIIPILASSLTVVLIFLIGQKIKGTIFGLTAALIILPTPLFLYFGKTPVHEPLVVFWVVLTVWFWLRYETDKTGLTTIFLVISLVLAELTTWAGFFIVPAITIVGLIKDGLSNFKKYIFLWLISIIIFLIHLMHTHLVTGSLIGGDLMGVLLQRSAISERGYVEGLSPLNYLPRLRLWMGSLYSNTLTLLSLIGVIYLYKNKLTDVKQITLTFFLFGITYLILFPNSSYIHNYLVFYLLPFIAFSAAWLINNFSGRYSLVVTALVMILIFVEKKDITYALMTSSADSNSVSIGKIINQSSSFDDQILIIPAKVEFAADKFIKFYGDRQVRYSDTVEGEYDLIFSIDGQNKKVEILEK